MSDFGRTLEREMERIPTARFTIEAVARTRDRRRRAQRVGSAVVAVAIAVVAAGWMARALREVPAGRPASPAPTGRIAFISGDGAQADRLYTVGFDGRDATMIADVHAEYPEWSSDGAAIAFDDGQNLHGSASRSPNGHIFTVSGDGSDLRQITVGGAAFAPSWSPNGTRLAVATRRSGSAAGISWLDLDTASLTPLTTNPYPGYWDGEPDVSPDGSRIAFIRVRELVERGGERNRAAVFVVNADGSGLRRLTAWNLDAGTPAWSPDGARIAFNDRDHSIERHPSQILVMSADGSDRERLTSGADIGGFWPTWSPDGSRIVFSRYVLVPIALPPQLASIPATGGHPEWLSPSMPGSASQADWGRDLRAQPSDGK